MTQKEMTGKPYIAKVECAENIALNYLLHEVPRPPQQKPTVSCGDFENHYVLPFSRERELVEILSFLAKTKEGSDYIPAMCVEQDSSRQTFKALLAVNKRTHTDGNHLLQSLKTGFEDIFHVLRRSLYGSWISSCVKATDLKVDRAREINRDHERTSTHDRADVLFSNHLSVETHRKKVERVKKVHQR